MFSFSRVMVLSLILTTIPISASAGWYGNNPDPDAYRQQQRLEEQRRELEYRQRRLEQEERQQEILRQIKEDQRRNEELRDSLRESYKPKSYN